MGTKDVQTTPCVGYVFCQELLLKSTMKVFPFLGGTTRLDRKIVLGFFQMYRKELVKVRLRSVSPRLPLKGSTVTTVAKLRLRPQENVL